MTKTKRNYWWLLDPCCRLSMIALLVYMISKDILERYSPFWMIPVVIVMLFAVVVVYRQFRSSILGKIMRNEPIAFDRSNEVPYEFDNPYMSKRNQEDSVVEKEDR